MPKQTEDIIMKSIFELFKGDAVKFFGIDARVTASARTELSHITIQRNTDDWLWDTDEEFILHFEFQSGSLKKDMSRFMVSDAILHFNTGKKVRTIVVYSADITETITTLDAGAIQYKVEAFYMFRLDGDKTYADIKAKVDAGKPLTKQDLMSIVFLPMMKNSVDKTTRFEQAISLSKEMPTVNEQAQIQAMLQLLAEKFVKDPETLRKLKEMVNMGIIAEMIRDEEKKALAVKSLNMGLPIDTIVEITGLNEVTLLEIKAELNAA